MRSDGYSRRRRRGSAAATTTTAMMAAALVLCGRGPAPTLALAPSGAGIAAARARPPAPRGGAGGGRVREPSRAMTASGGRRRSAGTLPTSGPNVPRGGERSRRSRPAQPPSPLGMTTDSRELRFSGNSPSAALLDAVEGSVTVFASRKFLDSHGVAEERSALLRRVPARSGPGGGSFFSAAAAAASTIFSVQSDTGRDRLASESSGGGSSSSSAASPDGGGAGPVLGPKINLSDDERELFKLLTQVVEASAMTSTLRVAGGWVRDKLLSTEEFRRPATRLYGSSEEPEGGSVGGGGGGGGGAWAGAGGGGGGLLERLTSKFKSRDGALLQFYPFKGPSMGRQGGKLIGTNPGAASKGREARTNEDGTKSHLKESHPVDIDIALDDMLGREFADRLNSWLTSHGRDSAKVGVVLKNPEKSKHLETATMKVNDFWIDFVNLRAEEYTEDSRIPDLMRIGTAEEDAHRRDLTINALFYNVNTGRVEDWTGRGFEDLRRGVVATPLPPLTTLLDDPLRVLRSVRFAARLRFTMDDDLREAARDPRVRAALAQKVARERVGAEVDLMLRSRDPVGAMRLLINLRLAGTVFPVGGWIPDEDGREDVFDRGLKLLSSTHDHLLDCKVSPPIWCQKKRSLASVSFASEVMLMDDEEARRLLWYASFLKPLRDRTEEAASAASESESDGALNGAPNGVAPNGARARGRKANRSAITKLMVDELKRPLREAEAVERIMRAADDFTNLMLNGGDLSATTVLLSEIRVTYDFDEECGIHYFVDANGECYSVTCSMLRDGDTFVSVVDGETEDDPIWRRAMEFRLRVSGVLAGVGPLWRAALILSLSERLAELTDDELTYPIEGDYLEQDFEEMRRGVVVRYDTFAASILNLGLVGVWSQKPLIDGVEMKRDVLRNVPKGPVFRDIMEEQERWMVLHPGGTKEAVSEHLRRVFPEFVG